MKKSYIIPNTKLIQLSAEESILLTVSGGSSESETPGGFNPGTGGSQGGDYEGDLTRRQGGNSLWDNWSN